MYYKTAADGGEISIRSSEARDGEALRRLAQLDSSVVPAGELLVAEAADGLRAAIAVGSGEVIADPFRHTAEIVGMLALRASQLRGRAERPGLGRRLRAAISRSRGPGAAPQPAGALRPIGERR